VSLYNIIIAANVSAGMLYERSIFRLKFAFVELKAFEKSLNNNVSSRYFALMPLIS